MLRRLRFKTHFAIWLFVGLVGFAALAPLNPASANEGPLKPIMGEYPVESLIAGEQGRARYRVDVTPDGNPARCSIRISSGYPRLDAATCDAVMKTARFRVLEKDAALRRFEGWMSWRVPE